MCLWFVFALSPTNFTPLAVLHRLQKVVYTVPASGAPTFPLFLLSPYIARLFSVGGAL